MRYTGSGTLPPHGPGHSLAKVPFRCEETTVGWNPMRTFLYACVTATLIAPCRGERTASSGLNVRVEPACQVSVQSSTVESPQTGIASGAIQFRYWVRTGRSAGGGQIRLILQGPQQPAQGSLDHRVTLSAVGIPTTRKGDVADNGNSVVEFRPDAHTSRDGGTGTVVWKVIGPPPGLSYAPASLSISCY